MALITIDAVVDIAPDAAMVRVSLRFRVAIGALEHRIVVRIDVAGGTNSVGVAVVGGEWRVLRMVKSRIQPAGGVVARSTSGREELRLRRMARIRGVLVVGLVAAVTVGWQRRVIVVHVAIDALPRRRSMHARERECRLVVIELAISPKHGVVAKFAGGREAYRDVVDRTLSVVVVRLMTSNAG